jgi:hypothetical protein
MVPAGFIAASLKMLRGGNLIGHRTIEGEELTNVVVKGPTTPTGRTVADSNLLALVGAQKVRWFHSEGKAGSPPSQLAIQFTTEEWNRSGARWTTVSEPQSFRVRKPSAEVMKEKEKKRTERRKRNRNKRNEEGRRESDPNADSNGAKEEKGEEEGVVPMDEDSMSDYGEDYNEDVAGGASTPNRS